MSRQHGIEAFACDLWDTHTGPDWMRFPIVGSYLALRLGECDDISLALEHVRELDRRELEALAIHGVCVYRRDTPDWRMP